MDPLESTVIQILSLGISRNDICSLPVLTRYILSEFSSNPPGPITPFTPHDCHRAVIHLFCLFPAHISPEIVRMILIRSLMRLPEPDFAQITSLLPSTILLHPEIQPLIELEATLQSGRFKEFWSLLNEGGVGGKVGGGFVSPTNLSSGGGLEGADLGRNVESNAGPNRFEDTKKFEGFVESIRSFMIGVIQLTYHLIRRRDLSQLLNLSEDEGGELDTVISANGWGVEDGGNFVRIGGVGAGGEGGEVGAEGKVPLTKLLSLESINMYFDALKK